MEYVVSTDSLEYIATGGHGKVFKLKNTDLIIKYSKNRSINLVEEGEILQLLQSVKYFPRLHSFGDDFIIMEYIPGISLMEWLMQGNVITENIIKQTINAFELCLLKGIHPVELEPDHIILTDNKIRIIDLGMYKNLGVVIEPITLQFKLEEFEKRFMYWVNHWSN